MLTRQALSSIPKSLGGRTLPVIVSSRKPTYWKCGNIDHLAHSSSEKASGDQLIVDQNSSQSPVSSFSTSAILTSVVKPSVTSLLGPAFPDISLSDKEYVE